MKLKDTHMIGIIAGTCGCLSMLIIEQFLLRTGLSKRAFSEMAAGVYVNKYSEVVSWQGRILGVLMEFGLCGLTGIIKANLLLKTGLKHLVPKGLMFGMTTGGIVIALVGAFAKNKVRPRDAVTNLAYLLKSAVFGVVTTLVIAKISDKSLFTNSQVPIAEVPHSSILEN
jgi:hypothetical protein